MLIISKKICLSVAFFMIAFSVLSQNEIGKPFVKNFSSKKYDAHVQNWDIVQDSRGVMYFANGDGVLVFDGKYWDLIPLVNQFTGRSLAIDNNDRVYVGSSADFGYLEPNSSGKFEYQSLTHLINDSLKFQDIWGTRIINNDVFFHSYKYLFKYNGKEVIYNKAIDRFRHVLEINGQVFIQDYTEGIFKYENDSLVPIPETNKFKPFSFAYDVDINETQKVFTDNPNGIRIIESSGNDLMTKLEIIELDESINQRFAKNHFGCGVRIDDRIAFGSSYKGCLITDLEKRSFQYIDKSTGMQNDFVNALFQDTESNLWIALNNGVSVVYVASPISYWNESNGMQGTVNAIIRHNNTIYVASHQGIYCYENGNFKKIEGINNQCWTFLEVEDGKNPNQKRLLFGSNNGLFEIRNNKITKLFSTETLFKIYRSTSNPNRILLGLKTGVASVIYENNELIVEGKYKNAYYNVRSIFEDENKDIWLGTFRSGVVKIVGSDGPESNYTVKNYTLENGFASLKNILIFPFKDYFVCGTEKGIYRYENDSDMFVYDSVFGEPFTSGENDVFSFHEDLYGNIWLAGLYSKSEKVCVGIPKEDGSYEWNYEPFKYIPEMMLLGMYVEEDGNAWFGGSDGLFLFNSSLFQSFNYDYNTLIRKVTLNQDSVIFNGNFFEYSDDKKVLVSEQPDSFIPKVHYKQNSITFHFSAASYVDLEKLYFRYYLEGFDERWSDWTLNSFKQYTNLPEGTYTFNVESRNIFNKYGAVAKYHFIISPPWYRTIVAYLIYFVLGISLIVFSTLIYSRRLREANIRLEKVVMERTAEIEHQKEEIQMQAEHLAQINEELEKLSIVAEETDNAVVITDQDGFFEYTNEGFRKMYGYGYDELGDLRTNNIVTGSDNTEFKEKFKYCKEHKQSISYETLTYKSNNEKFWAQTTLTPILDEDGEIVKFVAIDSDITRLKEADAEIYQQKEEILAQRDEIESQRDEIQAQRDLAVSQRDELAEKNEEILESIKYAYRIQNAILPKKKYVNEVLNEYFIINKPKGIVSGDFYFISKVDDTIIICVGDCTGHGVPGALLSMLGLTFLDKIVRENRITSPEIILDHLRKNMILSLQQSEKTSSMNDGMDISLFAINTKTYIGHFSGANNPAIILSDGQINETTPDKMPIALDEQENIPFSKHHVNLKRGDVIYLFSDGYNDQFGGTKAKKFMMPRFKNLLLEISDKSLAEQKDILLEKHLEWKNDREQIDDILVLGVKI